MESTLLKDAKVLVWDMDGVLIYVRESYRKAIIETTQYYFGELAGLNLEGPLLTVEDTQHFKMLKGFNDDWKLTYACVLSILSDLISRRGLVDELSIVPPVTVEEKLEALKKLGTTLHGVTSSLDTCMLAEKIVEEDHGLDSTERALEEVYGREVVSAARDYWYIDIIKTVFQEMYLGVELYRKKYGEEVRYIKSDGLISTETAIVSIETMERLAERFRMGVASGRERFEIDYSLKSHGLDRFIPLDLVVSSEDVEYGKPNPESLLESRKRIAAKWGLPEDAPAVYVGDSIDDVRAAKNAGFRSVGCLSAAGSNTERDLLRREFTRLGCDLILDDANGLVGSI